MPTLVCLFLAVWERIRKTDSWAIPSRLPTCAFADLSRRYLQQPFYLPDPTPVEGADALNFGRRRPWPAQSVAG